MRWLCASVAVLALQACTVDQHPLTTTTVLDQSISQRVTASGSLSPQDTVLVGSQVSGTIRQLYVDYNSHVHVGEVLARLDPTQLRASLDQATATLAQVMQQRNAAASSLVGATYTTAVARDNAQSQYEQIRAADGAVRKAESTLRLANVTLQRDLALLSQGFVAQNVVDNDRANQATARAELVGAQTNARSARLTSAAGNNQANSSAAQASQAEANALASGNAVRAAEAAVASAQYNLDHATIVSPVDGTVIQRNVSVGQTVAAALQAPTLFSIAKDLRKMELDVAVGEPDVGAVQPGDAIAFTVLAYPGRTFTSRVEQVRQNPTVVNNVTTYNTVAYPANTDGALRPGMTANVQITVATYNRALVVPLSALQWRPSATTRKRYKIIAAPAGVDRPNGAHSTWGQTGGSAEFAVSVGGTGHLYVLAGKELREVRVSILAIDSTRVGISVLAGRLNAGDVIVTGES